MTMKKVAALLAALLMLALCGAASASGPVMTLPASLTTIQAEAFQGDGAIREVVLPYGVTRIEARAFANSGLTRIYLPVTLQYIAPDAFSGCSVTAWGDYNTYARAYCDERGIPFACDRPVSASDFTFEFTSDTEATLVDYRGSEPNLVIPSMADATHRVTKIKNLAFWYYSGSIIETVSIPDTVVELGSSAFRDCEKLEYVYIPGSVQTTGTYLFDNCPALKRVDCGAGFKSLGSTPFTDCPALSGLNLPDGMSGTLKLSDLPALTRLRVPRGIASVVLTNVGISAMKDLELPDTVNLLSFTNLPITEIGASDIPASVTEISRLRECPNLKSVELPGTVTQLGMSLFSGCAKLERAYIPDSVTSCNTQEMFRGCSALTDVRLPDSWVYLGNDAFRDCASLRTVHLPNALTSMNNGWNFQGCTSLTSLVIPEGVERIYPICFESCTSLSSVSLPRNIELGKDSDFNLPEGLVFTLYYGTQAWEFAVENGLNYVALEHPAVITAQPKRASGAVGGSAEFAVAAEHATGYRWQVSKDGGSTWANLSGTGASLTVSITAQSAGWLYRCAVTGEDGRAVYSESAGIHLAVVGDSAELYSVTPSVSQAVTDETVTFTLRTSLNISDIYLVAKSRNYMWLPLDYNGTWAAEDCAAVSGDELVWTVQYAFPYSSYSSIYFYGIGAVRDEDDGSVSNRKTDWVYADLKIVPPAMADITELSAYLEKSLKEATGLTNTAIGRTRDEWYTENQGTHFKCYDLSPVRVQNITLDSADTAHTLYGVSNAMTLEQKRAKLSAQGWTQSASSENRYNSPDGSRYMLLYESSTELQWSNEKVIEFVRAMDLTFAPDHEEYLIVGTGFDSWAGVQLTFSNYGWEYLTKSVRLSYDTEALHAYGLDDDPAGINTVNFNVEGRSGVASGVYSIRVQYYVCDRLFTAATVKVRVVTDASTLQHTEASNLFGTRMDRMCQKFPDRPIWMNTYFGEYMEMPMASKFRLDWRDHYLEWGSLQAPAGTGGYCVDMIEIRDGDYYHSLFGLYRGMPDSDKRALLEQNGWTERDEHIYPYADASYINASLGRIVEWLGDDIYGFMTPAAAAAAAAPSDITLFAMPAKVNLTLDGTERAEIHVWFACKNPDKLDIRDYYSNKNFTLSGFDTSLMAESGAGWNSTAALTVYLKLKAAGSATVQVTSKDVPYGTFTAETCAIHIANPPA